MTARFVQLHLWLAHRRGTVLALLLAGGAGVGLLGARLHMNEDFTDVLPLAAPEIAGQFEALRHLRQAERIYFDVATAQPAPDTLAAAADQLTAALRGIPHLGDVRGELDLAEVGVAYEELQAQLPSLLNSAELAALENKITATNLTARLAWLKKSMQQPQGLAFKNVALADPAGLGDAVAARLRALQAGAGDAQLVGGRVTSADGCHVLVNATPDFRSSDTGRSTALVAAVLAAARDVEKNFPPGAVKISIAGAHRAALDNLNIIRTDIARTSTIATLAIAALMFASWRRRWLALLGLLPPAVGALAGFAALQITGDLVSAVALGCGSMLIGVTVDYGICVIYRLDDTPPSDRATLAREVAGLIPSLTFGALTTMAAFFVMFASPVGGHRQLGLFGAVGVGAAAVFALLVLPLFIPVKTFPHARPLPLTGLLGKIFQWRERRQKIVLPALLGFSLICAAGVARVGFDGDIARLNGVTPATRRDDETFKQAWGRSLALTTVVVSGATRDAALADNERVAAVLEKLRAEKVIETFSSVAPLLPSAATRAANQNAWRAFWTPTRDAALADALNSTASGLGFRTELFAPWLERLRHFDDGAAPANPALTRLTGEFCNASDGKFYLATLVKTTDTTRFHQTRDAVQAAVPGARLLNKVALGDEITAVARRALPWFAVGVAALNALLIFLLLGRWELVLVTLLPMAAGIFWTLGALGLLGLRVDVANFIFVIFVVGVGGDYSLFQVLSELEAVRGQPDRAAATGGAVTLCALTSLLGTGVLVLARHPALFSVGLTALLGISFSLLATLFLVPPSVRWLAKKYSQRPQLTAPTPAEKLRAVSRRYRLQGAYISHFAFWKMKTDPLFVAVDAAVPMRGEILDVGCGYGLMAQWLTLAAPERRVLGVDFDAEKIRVAQAVARTNQQTTFAHRDLLDGAEFPPCDTALLGDVLHYFPDAVKAELLQRIFAALRPGGRLVLRDAMAEETSAHRTVTRWEKIAVRLGQNRTHHGLHFTDEPTHRALLCAAGFADVEIRRETGRGSNRLLLAAKPA